MESTWEQRDLPVLDAIVRYFDEEDSAVIPDVATFAEITRMDPGQVGRAVRALMGVTDEARQAVGQWPSPEVWVDRLVQALREAAEREPDPEKKGRLRAMAEGLGGFARDVAVGVLSGGITQTMGSS